MSLDRAWARFLNDQALKFDENIIADMRPPDGWTVPIHSGLFAERVHYDWKPDWQPVCVANAIAIWNGTSTCRWMDRFEAVYPDLTVDF